MLFKAIAHYFSKKRLDRHQRETNAELARYEVEKEQSDFRIQEHQMVLKESLEATATAKNAELEALVDTLNAYCSSATEMQPMMMALNGHIVDALDLWWQREPLRRLTRYHNERIHLIAKEKSFYIEAMSAYDAMCETEERKAWRHITESVPLAIDNVHVHAAQKHVDRWEEDREHELVAQKKRIKSAISAASRKLSTIREEKDATKEAEKALSLQLKQEREVVRRLYRELKAHWFSINDEINNHFPLSFSELMDKKRELFALKDDLYEDLNENKEQLAIYKSRIAYAHEHDDYSTFETDKRNRQVYFNLNAETFEELNDVKEEIGETLEQIGTIFKLRELLNKLHPDQQVEKIFALLMETEEKNGEQLYWDALGIKTKKVQKMQPPRQKIAHVEA
ncbi:hypothetical protein [Photobacterium kasasachensis]|uniref:hypothetical protein n=1 Tax=Photobacterium kasasachensis TaxID=2910240 RepID=UPI003D133111